MPGAAEFFFPLPISFSARPAVRCDIAFFFPFSRRKNRRIAPFPAEVVGHGESIEIN